ncbi:hypothetical protein [Nannocystis pusilla]|uniref:hypothetical protein n=1 Tax=Nannocystis pusilla TaxID=889268 RepID=UPI003DA2F1B3
MRLLIVTAADEGYATLLKGLVESLFQWGPPIHGELGVLDLDLSPETLEWLAQYEVHIVKPGWDIPIDADLARERPGLRAMTARPFLPRHFPGYDMYLWLDADTWVQQPFALDWLAAAAATGKMAIVPQIDRFYRHSPLAVHWRIDSLRCYFGQVPIEALLMQTYVNSGVFALHAGAPHWELWGEWMKQGIEACGGRLVTDQTALNFMLWMERLPVYPLPSRCNWTCHLALPEYRMATGLFHEPGIPGEPLGILHLTHRMKDQSVTARGTDGRAVEVSLRFDPARARDRAP